MVQAEKVENTSRHGVLGRHKICSTERFLVLSNTIERNHPLRHTPSKLYPESYYDEAGESYTRKYMRHLDLLQPPGLLTKEIEKDVLFGCEITNVSTVRLVKSCVTVSVERSDKDKDADGNVDADQISTVRIVKSGQSIGFFTPLEEIDIDFRVSGLLHAVVKQAENFRVRELVKKIESHPHREALQADLQQNNVYNPFSDDSKAMIREMGNVELFKLCETIPKVQ